MAAKARAARIALNALLKEEMTPNEVRNFIRFLLGRCCVGIQANVPRAYDGGNCVLSRPDKNSLWTAKIVAENMDVEQTYDEKIAYLSSYDIDMSDLKPKEQERLRLVLHHVNAITAAYCRLQYQPQ